MAKKNSRESEKSKKGVLDRFFGSSEEGEGTTETESAAATEEAQSATELLKQQHDEVRKLFKEYKSAGERAHATRKRIMDEAGQQLDMHARLEETIFYPACRELEDEKAQKMVGESLEEHAIVKRLIKEMRSLDGSDENFESKASVLMENVEHHAEEEESDLFPVAERELEEGQLLELGEKMAALKQRLMTREGSARKSSSRSTGRRAARA